MAKNIHSMLTTRILIRRSFLFATMTGFSHSKIPSAGIIAGARQIECTINGLGKEQVTLPWKKW
jgi:hypothetical protein